MSSKVVCLKWWLEKVNKYTWLKVAGVVILTVPGEISFPVSVVAANNTASYDSTRMHHGFLTPSLTVSRAADTLFLFPSYSLY